MQIAHSWEGSNHRIDGFRQQNATRVYAELIALSSRTRVQALESVAT